MTDNVRSRNPFELLGDDASDVDDVKTESKPKTQEKPVDASPKKTETSSKKSETKVEKTNGEKRGGAVSRGGKGMPRDVREEEPSQDGKETRAPKEARGSRGRGRGRQFDRHSGTDMRDSEKKSVAGKGTWGAPGVELEEVNGDAIAEEVAEVKIESEEEEEVKREPEPAYMTLEQYQESLKAKRAQAPTAAPRQANEGVDEKKWAGKVHEKKDDTEPLFAGKQQQKTLKKKERPQKEILEVDLRFADSSASSAPRGAFRGGRGRGGERGGRGGRGRGGDRGRGRSSGQTVDLASFPALGK